MEECTLPQMICCENVIGFEQSNSFDKWREVLSQRNYHVGHFHLTPTQVQLPNDRPRYFSVAVQAHSLSSSTDSSSYLGYLQHEDPSKEESLKIQSSIPELGVTVASEEPETADAATISTFLDTTTDNSDLRVPEKLLNSNAAWCFDIVTPNNRRSRWVLHAWLMGSIGALSHSSFMFKVVLHTHMEVIFEERGAFYTIASILMERSYWNQKSASFRQIG